MNKKKPIRAVILFVLAVLLLSCLIIWMPELANNLDSVQPNYTMNETWECKGNSITVTEIAAVDSYSSPDGTEYTPLTGEKLVIVRCKAILASGWEISSDTFIRKRTDCFLLCPPITEVNDNGETSQALLFSVPPNPFPDSPWYFDLRIYIRSGEEQEYDFFRLHL